MAAADRDARPYDALLFVSFGGPEGVEDVLPFLENVTRGRGIPRDRLEQVGQHYHRFGGVSPINEQCRALITALRQEFDDSGVDLPVYWGNRNWAPYLADALAEMTADGVRRALVFVTSAYASYSGCRQYRENLAEALASPEVAAAATESGNPPPRLDKLRHYFNHPGFARPQLDAVRVALRALPQRLRAQAPLLFVTHSVPFVYAETAGPSGGAYVAQHRDLAAWIADQLTVGAGGSRRWELVYCSRSGSPRQPWLEPDVNDRLAELHDAGVEGAVLVPIGFVSDHMEVRYDLDVEATETAAKLGMHVTRAATVGTAADFVRGIRELVLERARVERGESVERPTIGLLGPSHDVCPAGCCPNTRGPKPAACGLD